MLLTSNFVVLGILCLLVMLAQYISETRLGKPVGAALIVIILGALFANFNLNLALQMLSHFIQKFLLM